MTRHDRSGSRHLTIQRRTGRGRLTVRRAAAALGTLALLLLAPWCAAAGVEEDAASQKPNVLFLAIDDLNDWIGVLGGNPQSVTPNLDRLARRGLLFTRAYCAAPACNPSRTALLCGVRPSTSGVYLNGQPWRPVLPDAITLPQHFKAAGYYVVGGGKIFHGRYEDPPSWHEYFKRQADPAPPERPVNGIPNTAHFDWGPLDVPDAAMSDTKIVDWAIDYLAGTHERPFFLGVGLFRPHLPWYVPRSYFERFPLSSVKLPVVPDDDLEDIPLAGRRMARPEGDHRSVIDSDNWQRAVQGYLASIAFTDHNVGRLLDALDKSDARDNTIIVMWGDHGWHLGEKQHWRKFALWEETTRVPMVFVVPGMTKPEAESERTVSLLDVYPTLVELCGLEPKPELEGKSLVPLLNDPASQWERPVLTTHGRGNHSVRNERWRYIRYSDGSEELYDHADDPMEWNNLAAQSRHESVKAELARWIPKQEAPGAPERRRSNRRPTTSLKTGGKAGG